MIVPPVKNKPVSLHCHATVELEKSALKNLQCGDSDLSLDLDFDDSERPTPDDDYDEEAAKVVDPEREQRILNGYASQQKLTHFTDLKSDGDTDRDVQHLSNPFGNAVAGLGKFDEEEDDNEGEDLTFGERMRQRRSVIQSQVT